MTFTTSYWPTPKGPARSRIEILVENGPTVPSTWSYSYKLVVLEEIRMGAGPCPSTVTNKAEAEAFAYRRALEETMQWLADFTEPKPPAPDYTR